MNEVEKLMNEAQKQLDEHRVWLTREIDQLPAAAFGGAGKECLIDQALMIKLRMARAATDNISILWEYPDELMAFLRSPNTPEHIRETLNGGCSVDLNEPGFSAKRAPS